MAEPAARTVTPAVLRGWPLPVPGADKESRGRTLVVAGSARTPGAALLAAEAALRAGAGKLQVATAGSVAAGVALAVPEAMVVPLPETSGGGLAGTGATAELQELVEQAGAVLVGPGMSGPPEECCALVAALLPHVRGTVVLDALALAQVGQEPGCLGHLDARVVLTPNARELGLTLGVSAEDVAGDPATATAELAAQARAVVSCGGGDTWTVAADGRRWVDQTGGAGLGVSGSGDVKAGVIVGLAARGADPAQAAVWGAHLHGRAGDRLAAAVGRLGFLARQLPAEVPRVLAELET